MVARRTHTSRRRRRALAATACVLWLLGVEVLPSLHLAFHADDHTHEADGTIVRVGGAHGHGAHGHGHGHDGHGGHAHDHGGHAHDHGGHAHDHAPAPPAMLAAAPAAGDPTLPAGDAAADLAVPAAAADAAADDAGAHRAPDTGHDHGRHRRHRDELALDAPGGGHAAAGIAHHAVALHRPPPPLLEPLPVRRAAWRVDDVREHQHPCAFHARPTARGPPAAA